jgi:tetratricopeptide (TPR) repeat protein
MNTATIAAWAAAAVAVLATLPTLLRPADPPAPPSPAPAGSAATAAAAARMRAEFEPQLAGLREAVAALQERLDAVVHQRLAAPPSPADAKTPPAGDGPASKGEVAGHPAGSGLPPEQLRAFRGDLARMFRNGLRNPPLSEQEQQRFWELARTPGLIDGLLRELEAAVEAAPGDAAARLQLADACTARLLTLPGGPEQGVWSGKAEKQWTAVLAQDPDHWEARFLLGFNYSMYPSFVDRSTEAIEHLERARTLQQGMPPEPRQVDTYAALARMYARQQKRDRAREVLAEGLQRFPGDETLLRAQQQLGH